MPHPKQRRPLEQCAKVAIVGSPTVDTFHWPYLCKMLDRATFGLVEPTILTFGYSKRVIDQLVKRWCSLNWYVMMVYYLDHGRAKPTNAFDHRVEQMCADADYLIVFQDDDVEDRLVNRMTTQARKVGVKIKKFNI